MTRAATSSRSFRSHECCLSTQTGRPHGTGGLSGMVNSDNTQAQRTSMRPQPLIAVADVEASSQWYQHLLGCESAHGLWRRVDPAIAQLDRQTPPRVDR